MESHFSTLDWVILAVYFLVLASIGPLFARRNKSTETYFVGNRSFPAWLLGLAMFATSISSITVVAYPADAYKTAYLRLLPAFMLPLGIYIASKVFLPFFRRSRCTSAFEYLEGRFGPGVRMYAACSFLFGQIMRISTILYLVSLVFQQMTGASPYACIVVGGLVIGTYTVLGGIKAIVWTQFVQAFVLWFGAFLCLKTVLAGIDGGISTVISTALADGKFMMGDLNPVSGKLEPAPWVSFQEKAILMMFLCGITGWLTEYSSNQNVIQKYVSAKNPKEATRSIWICCFCSVPTWAFFMFLGTSIYVYFKLHPDEYANAILSGAAGAKAESILPYFCVTAIPSGLLGLVIAGILSAAMSASASSVSSISAVGVTDIYRRHIARSRDEKHYVLVARVISTLSVLVMMFGATLFLNMSKLTLQDTGAKLAGLFAGGLLGLYVLGFLTTRGNSRTVAIAILLTILFSTYIAAIELKWITREWFIETWGLSESAASWLSRPVHTYYTGVVGNLILFFSAYGLGCLFEKEKKDLTNYTVWTMQALPEEE
ncbi:MAG: sodium:solute symporter [Candidatus Omnitrophica bacterium]|nr:sodium:solute symporter [Candidatus Omnitrophota bacterium]